jgi:phospholipid/cholesterol/gamma-HCH transport system substrate-binding protein
MRRVAIGHAVTVVLATVVAGAFLTALLLSSGAPPSFDRGGYVLRVIAPTAASLGPGAGVRIAGLPVGQVSAIDLRGTTVVITLDINRDQGPLAVDTRWALRLRSLIGENYIELYPGHQRAMLSNGAVLAMSAQRDEYVDLEQILDVLKGRARIEAQQMLRSLARSVGGRGAELNQFVAQATGVLQASSPLMSTLNGDREQVAGLIQHIGNVMAAVGREGASIRSFATGLRITASAISARDSSLRSTLGRLPGTLLQVRRTSQVLRSVVGTATPVITELAASVDALRPAVATLAPAAQDARTSVRDLGSAAPALQTILNKVTAVSTPAVESLPQLGKLLCQVNPSLRYLTAYGPEMSATFENMASATNYFDAGGHGVRLYSMVGEYSLPPLSSVESGLLKTLFNTNVLSKVHQIGYNPYPAPGDEGPPKGGTGYVGPSDYKPPYPHVLADC